MHFKHKLAYFEMTAANIAYFVWITHDTHEIDGIEYDGLLFWKCKHQDFPNLKIVARQYLSISVSSVAVEGMFSTNGHIVNSRRLSLSPAKLNYTFRSYKW